MVGNLAKKLNKYSKKHCTSLFWRMKAALKKAVENGGGKHQFRFHYDPSSYALNFDDGIGQLEEKPSLIYRPNNGVESYYNNNCTWIYVIWVESLNPVCIFHSHSMLVFQRII